MLLRASASVSYQMESDDCQDTSGYQSRQGDQYGFQMGDKSRESLTSGPPQFGLTPPFAKDNATAGEQHYQRHPYEQSPKTDVQSRRVPINDLLGSVRRFILKRLYVANEKRGHKQDGWEDQEPLCTGSDCGRDPEESERLLTCHLDGRRARANHKIDYVLSNCGQVRLRKQERKASRPVPD